MSGFNINAKEFVPSFGKPPAFIREEATEAPRPPPTLSIGKPTPPPQPAQTHEMEAPAVIVPNPVVVPVASTPPPAAAPKAAPPKASAVPSAPTGTKTFTTEKAKTDSNKVHDDVKAVADQETLKDLFGDSKFSTLYAHD